MRFSRSGGFDLIRLRTKHPQIHSLLPTSSPPQARALTAALVASQEVQAQQELRRVLVDDAEGAGEVPPAYLQRSSRKRGDHV